LSEQKAALGGVASVDRALSLLAMFTGTSPVLSLSELAGRTQQYKSTVLRLLASLEHAHLVLRQEDGRFSLGSGIARLHAVYAASFSLADVVLPSLQELVQITRESAGFHVRQGDRDLCLSRVDSPHSVRDHTRPGDFTALDRSAVGPLLQAYAGAAGTRAARIRREQMCVTDGDIVPELAGISAPVFGAAGEFIGAIVLSMPSNRKQATHADAVARAARAVTQCLGGTYPHPPARGERPAASIRGNPG
jgi:DNA-binding IclR family transcriptional regulator